MKKYIVIERSRNWDSFDFINEDTKNLGDIWNTHCPYKLSEDKKDGLKPMLFESRQDAVKYKNTQQSRSNKDWNENRDLHKMLGESKPKWKVEEYSGNLFK
mgnify:FL=1|tara:strand:+ start:3819 stop:4121 length:303 start_codon:yes stop_codon:yes gene_type:complete